MRQPRVPVVFARDDCSDKLLTLGWTKSVVKVTRAWQRTNILVSKFLRPSPKVGETVVIPGECFCSCDSEVEPFLVVKGFNINPWK